MSYGELKIDTITFTSAGVDASVSVSGLVQNPTFTGNITTTGTISGDIIRGNTVSGATVTGDTGEFGNLTAVSGVFTTQVSGATITGETGEFAGAITASGFIPNGTGVLTNGLYSPAANRVALSTNSTNHFTVTESGVFLFATGVVATGVTDRGGSTQFTPKTQLAGQGSNRDTALSLLHYSSAGFSPTIVLGTSNSNTFGEYTDTVSGRVYGDILFETANETNDRFGAGALIRGFADHTPGAGLNGVPGALSFFTSTAGTEGNTERMRIASSGNVGIGNFTNGTPDALLELKGSAAVVGTPELFISNFGAVTSGNTSSTITFRGGATGSETNIARFTVIADGNDENGGHLAFETTASGGSLTERARIDSSGRLGLGTNSPSNDLDILKTVAGSTTTARIGATATTGGNSAVLILNNGGTGQAKLRFDYEADTERASISVDASNQRLDFNTANAASPRISIDSSGQVGIGITSPSTLLHLKSNAPYIRFEDDNDNQDWEVRATTRFALFDVTNSSERLSVTSAGRVGIGITNPAAALVVSNGGAEGWELDFTSGTTELLGYNRSTSARTPMKIIGQTFLVQTGNPSLSNGLYQNSSGNVGIGTTSPVTQCTVYGSASAIQFQNTNTGSAGGDGFFVGNYGGLSASVWQYENDVIQFATNNTQRMRLHATGYLNMGGWLTSSNYHRINGINVTQGNIILNISAYQNSGGSNIDTAYFYGCDSTTYPNAADTAIKVFRNSGNNRSINAAGTINASGADYAEYMFKAGDFTIAKGDICGINAEGKLTNVFADAISFAVKSTDPSYVGGDTWHLEAGEQPGGYNDDRTEEEIAAAKVVYEQNLEAARQKVDRISFAGQVPVNVTGATSGQYIVPVEAADGGIEGAAKNEADLTLAEYMHAVGKVVAIEDDGSARIIVKVA